MQLYPRESFQCNYLALAATIPDLNAEAPAPRIDPATHETAFPPALVSLSDKLSLTALVARLAAHPKAPAIRIGATTPLTAAPSVTPTPVTARPTTAGTTLAPKIFPEV